MSWQRPALWAAVVGLAVVVGWVLFAPDTHVPEPPPRAAPLPVAPVTAAAPAPAPTPRVVQPGPRPPAPLRPPVPFVPRIQPRPPVDPDRVYDVGVGGIGSALFDRYPEILDCYNQHTDTYGKVQGRPTVRATVMPDGGFEISVENEGEGLASFDQCLVGATAGLVFDPPDVPTTVLHPIPIPHASDFKLE